MLPPDGRSRVDATSVPSRTAVPTAGGPAHATFRPTAIAYAHCDLPCGVYDPAQARIEAESVKAIMEKYQGNDDPVFRTRALMIKEQRAELVKHHLWVLWTDYFKPAALREVPAAARPVQQGDQGGRRGRRQGHRSTRPRDRSCST